MNGYMGKLLFVNLTTGECETRLLSEEDARNYLGGPALGAKILYEEMPAKADVFGAESVIGFVTGPLNNTGAMYGGRYTVVSKSPVTGGWNDANSGGYFGSALRRAGYDAVFVRGIAAAPVYIFIEDGVLSLLSAAELWGKTVRETEAALRAAHGPGIRAALIGPAGENLSYFAAVMNDNHRAAARGGSGAIMGSKKLKALVVSGSQKTPVADPEGLKALAAEIKILTASTENGQDMSKYGTGSGYAAAVTINDAGIRNWTGSGQRGYYTGADAQLLSSPGLEKDVVKSYSCDSCPLGCGAEIRRTSSRWDLETDTMRPEYETMGAFGSLLCNKDVDAVCRCNNLCNDFGFDTISAGGTIAWVMECYNEGILSRTELDGIDLTWGNGDAIVALMEKICANDGIGHVLQKGSREAARILGKGEEYLVTAGGIEQPQHDTRFYYGLGRTYMADPTPGRHVKGSISGCTMDEDFDPQTSLQDTGFEDMLAVVDTEILNACGMCSFCISSCTPLEPIMPSIRTVTGFSYSPSEKIALGLRMFAMRQAFNLREGLRREDVILPVRMRRGQPPYSGTLANMELDFNAMVDSLYTVIGWTKDGVPKQATLDILGMAQVKADLYPETINEQGGVSGANSRTFPMRGGTIQNP